ncbi:MAG: DNA gyrase C-terminal beta-propeller domain-containing protein, partial [Alphaproteobacteria bacterium]|nr:DNA gyrase C-terminal beta-propeller domain-containing protein [Alphaproteobacteria bacterium]
AIEHDVEALEQAMIEKEAVTVIISEMGWARALKGHLSSTDNITFKEGDQAKFILPAYTTDKLLLVGSDGRFFALNIHTLPGGRGQGEPIRLLLELEQDQELLGIFIYKPDDKLLLISHQGYGFMVTQSELLSTTRKGKQIMKVKAPDRTALCKVVSGTHLAIIGDNRKLLVFPLTEIPHMSRGKGVRLQKYKDGGVRDAICFDISTGLQWHDSAGRSFTRQAEEITEWQGSRAAAGRMAPRGFPKSGYFET